MQCRRCGKVYVVIKGVTHSDSRNTINGPPPHNQPVTPIMYARLLGITALLVASVAYLLAGRASTPPRAPYHQGRNRTVLFVGNREDGLVNAQLATASALLAGFPDMEVHFASFPRLRSKVERVSAAASPPGSGRAIVFHELAGVDFGGAALLQGKTLDAMPHAPGSAGIAQLTHDMQIWICPWSAKDYLDIFREVSRVIDEVDPAVVVLEPFFHPAVDAARGKNWLHAFISANTLVDSFVGMQPRLGFFWKYPAVSSGFSFPLPLRDIPENVYLNLRFAYSVLWMPALSSMRATLRANGIANPSNFYAVYREDAPWISQTTEGASIPVDYVPPNVTSAGPISLRSAPAAEQDAELAAWMKRAPTVLVNLGSSLWVSRSCSGRCVHVQVSG